MSATDQADTASKRRTTNGRVNILVLDDEDLSSHNIPKRSTPPPPPEINLSFPENVQVFNISRNGKKGKTIGQIQVNNPDSLRLKWAMRHRYRNGGETIKD